jgi:hypothetical protein
VYLSGQECEVFHKNSCSWEPKCVESITYRDKLKIILVLDLEVCAVWHLSYIMSHQHGYGGSSNRANNKEL